MSLHDGAATLLAGMVGHVSAAVRVGVAVLIKDGEGRILLGRRAKQPNFGKWVLPGGGIEFGESWLATGAREVREETGLLVSLPKQRPYVLQIIGPDEHRVILVANAKLEGGMLKASSDLSEVRFFSPDDLPGDLSPMIKNVLAEVCRT
jgi:ADP-ribose pyrophosphatase YjhB (NUDIX family)